MEIRLRNKLKIILVLLILIAVTYPAISINKYKIQESDSVYFQSIDNLKFSNDGNLFVVNQKTKTNRINIFKKDGTLFKSYLIDDSFTDKYFDIIEIKEKDDKLLTTKYLNTQPKRPKILYNNIFDQSLFINDSLIYCTAYINYYTDGNKRYNFKGLVLKNMITLVIINVYNDKMEALPLEYKRDELYPQTDYLEFYNNNIYYRLFPYGYYKIIPNSPKYVLGKLNINNKIWEPIVKLPKEYEDSKVNLELDYRFNIANFKNEVYFNCPFLNYVYNLKGDTIRFTDLDNSIQYSLSRFGSDTLIKSNGINMLDSLCHYIGGIFFKNGFLYNIVSKTKSSNNKIYLNKYNLNGKLIVEKLLNENLKLFSAFYS